MKIQIASKLSIHHTLHIAFAALWFITAMACLDLIDSGAGSSIVYGGLFFAGLAAGSQVVGLLSEINKELS
jgi:hypothetical protein